VIADDGIEDRGAPFLQCEKRARLISLHKAAVSDHVGYQHCGQAAFHDPFPLSGV
jgi:hypothetical protein